jgi:hypothetical protein
MSNAECYKCKTALFSAMFLCVHFFQSFMFCDVLCKKHFSVLCCPCFVMLVHNKTLGVMKSLSYGLLVHKKTARVMQSSRYGLLDHKKTQNRRLFLISVSQDFFDVIIVLWKITNLIYLKLFQAINFIHILIEILSVLESNPKFDIQSRKKLNDVE